MSNGASPSDTTVRVLICDDNQPLRELLRAVIGLRPSLRVVGEARDGNEAVVEAKRLQPDIVMLDLAMPQRTGLDALPELRQVAPAAGIIVFSGFSTTSVAEEAIALGAAYYLSKGAGVDEIDDAIEAVAARASEPLVTAGVTSE